MLHRSVSSPQLLANGGLEISVVLKLFSKEAISFFKCIMKMSYSDSFFAASLISNFISVTNYTNSI